MKNIVDRYFRIYGDNILECFKVVDLIKKNLNCNYLEINNSQLISPEIIIKNKEKTYNLKLFSAFNRWSIDIVKFIAENWGSNLYEYPDAIVTEHKINSLNEKVLFAVEFSNALSAGNQAWQRHGRWYSFSKIDLPFFFITGMGSSELNSDREIISLRSPNPATILSYLNFSKIYKKPIFPIFVFSDNADNEFKKKFSKIEGTNNLNKLITGLLNNNKFNEKDVEENHNNTWEYYKFLINKSKNLNSEKEIIIKLSQDFNSQKFINYYNSSPKKWKKSVSIPTTNNFKKFQKLVEQNSSSIISTNLPFALIREDKKENFFNSVYKIYKSKEILEFSKKKNIIVSFILGFKPKGDDARPDRGLTSFIKTLFNDDINIFTIIYGPAKKNSWDLLVNDPKILGEKNGLFNSIFAISDCILVDSKNYPKKSKNFFLKKEYFFESPINSKGFFVDPISLEINEHDVDNSIILFFNYFTKNNFFESMVNPPGGDWSSLKLKNYTNNKIYSWTNLPRVSGVNSKRPDHIYTILHDNKNYCLIIESKNKNKDLDKNIGERLKNYIIDLTKYKPSNIYNSVENYFENKLDIFDKSNIEFISCIAYYEHEHENVEKIKILINECKCEVLFLLKYDQSHKISLKIYSNNEKIINIFKKYEQNLNNINILIIQI